MKSHYRVVVIGGGNMGTGVLYHLAQLGWNDCALIEKAELTSGATWHAAGLVSRMIGGTSLGSLHDYAVDFYKNIEAQTGVSVSWHGCGSLRVATSNDHLDWISHLYDCISARGQDVALISAAEVSRLNPLYDVQAAGVLAALYTPDDGHVDPSGACQAMAKGARLLGADIIRHNRVTDIRQSAGGDWQLITERGVVQCEHVVNAGGYHARQIGAFNGLDLPITTLLHHYAITEDVPEFAAMAHEIPVTRDDYFCGYLRREQKSALIGLYDKQDPQSVWLNGCPWHSQNALFEPNLDNILPWLENCFQRCPALQQRGLKRIVNGGISYTPDGAMLLGPAPGLKNYWLACGATVGIAWGPGAGRTLAQWMVHGSAEVSTRAYDPRRFGRWADAEFSRRRSTEDYTLRQAMPYPRLQRQTMRNIKTSGAYRQTRALGAEFEEAGGWERPSVYGQQPLTWRRSDIDLQLARECKSVRENVGLADFSAFAKFKIKGSMAECFLNKICANRLPRKPYRTCLSLLLNHRGTIEGEVVLAKLDTHEYYLVTGAPSERRIEDWFEQHRKDFSSIDISNITDETGVLVVAGPRSRDLLCGLTETDLSNHHFPWRSAQVIRVAGIEVIALRLSFTGELAWELHAPNDRLGELWDSIWQAGAEHDIGVFGARAVDSLRLEKFYRGAHELSNDVTHKEAGLMHFVDLDKDFIGRAALLNHQASSQCVLLALQDEPCDCLGGEAVYINGQLAGTVSSAAFGYSLGMSLAAAYVKPDLARHPEKIEVSLLGQRVEARILDNAPYDQHNSRLKV